MIKNEYQQNGNFINQDDFYNLIEKEVKTWLDNPANHLTIEKAKQEKWFGNQENKKDYYGLCGFLRANFGIQIKVLNKLDNPVVIPNLGNPSYYGKFRKFLTSEWLKNKVLENGGISHSLILKKLIDCLNPNLINPEQI